MERRPGHAGIQVTKGIAQDTGHLPKGDRVVTRQGGTHPVDLRRNLVAELFRKPVCGAEEEPICLVDERIGEVACLDQ